MKQQVKKMVPPPSQLIGSGQKKKTFTKQNVKDAKAIGELIKKTRKESNLTQANAAALCGVGTRFISDLENGKPTLQLEHVLKVINAFGLEIIIQRRGL